MLPVQQLMLIRLAWINSLFSVCHPELPEDAFPDSLTGDSITQGAWDQSRGFAMGAELASAYSRRFDVINRGFSYAYPSISQGLSLTRNI